MQYTTALVTLLAATAVNAGPKGPSHWDSAGQITVTLTKANSDGKVAFVLPDELIDRPAEYALDSIHDFNKVHIRLGSAVKNKDLRCKVVPGSNGNVMPATRDGETDVTFTDKGAGDWVFHKPGKVGKVVCDSKYKQLDPRDERISVSVVLDSHSVTRSAGLSGGSQNHYNLGDDKVEYDTVKLVTKGIWVNPALRCQLEGPDRKVVKLVRNGEERVTFSDAGNGQWDFSEPQRIGRILCSPHFQ